MRNVGLTNVWDVLEHKVRLHAKDAKGRLGRDEADREFGEVNRLKSELWKKGTTCDKLIIDLFNSITIQPGGSMPLPFEIRELSPKEFRQFRSKVEPMSDEMIAEAIRQQNEENMRKAREIAAKRRRPNLPSLARY